VELRAGGSVVRHRGLFAGDDEETEPRRSELDETWSASDAFRAITDDDLLRFFAVFQTAGKLG
jgi:hypothetical protein